MASLWSVLTGSREDRMRERAKKKKKKAPPIQVAPINKPAAPNLGNTIETVKRRKRYLENL